MFSLSCVYGKLAWQKGVWKAVHRSMMRLRHYSFSARFTSLFARRSATPRHSVFHTHPVRWTTDTCNFDRTALPARHAKYASSVSSRSYLSMIRSLPSFHSFLSSTFLGSSPMARRLLSVLSTLTRHFHTPDRAVR